MSLVNNDEKKMYVLEHEHPYGTDFHVFYSKKSSERLPADVVIAETLGLEFDPHDTLSVRRLEVDDIQDFDKELERSPHVLVEFDRGDGQEAAYIPASVVDREYDGDVLAAFEATTGVENYVPGRCDPGVDGYYDAYGRPLDQSPGSGMSQ